MDSWPVKSGDNWEIVRNAALNLNSQTVKENDVSRHVLEPKRRRHSKAFWNWGVFECFEIFEFD